METSYQSDGSHIAGIRQWAKRRLGHDLLAWQQRYLTGVTATLGGRLVHRQSLVSTARQNGKSEGALALIGWALEALPDITGEPCLALLVAHDLRLTTRLFERTHAVLDKAGLVERVRFSFGRQDMRLSNGSELIVQADTPSAGHGYSRVGLIYGDETWHLHADCWEQGLLPTTRTTPQPIILMTSTAGDETSDLLKRWRDKGIRAIDTGDAGSFYFAEWSPPPGVDPLDEQYWRYSNPALGVTIPISTLREESTAPNRAQFLRASLNLWVSSAAAWLDPGVWEGLQSPFPALQGGVLALEVSQAGDRFVGVRAARTEGQVGVEVAFAVDEEARAWVEVERLMRDRQLSLAISPSFIQHLPQQYAERHRVVGWAELAKWTMPVRSVITHGGITHRGDLLLAEHVCRAVLTRGEYGQGISSNKSPGPIELARCMVWAAHLVLTPDLPPKHKPTLAFG